MANGNEESYYNYYSGFNFDGYVVQSKDPDFRLVLSTFGYILFCIVVGLFLCDSGKRKDESRNTNDSDENETYHFEKEGGRQRRNQPFTFDPQKYRMNSIMDNGIVTLSQTSSTDTRKNPALSSSSSLPNQDEYYQVFDDGVKFQLNRDDEMISPKGYSSLVQSTGRSRMGKLQMMKQMSQKSVSVRTEEDERLRIVEFNIMRNTSSDESDYGVYPHNAKHERLASTRYLSGYKNHQVEMQDENTNGTDDSLKRELKKILGLAVPWSLSSFMGYASSIIAIASISHNIGLAEMLSYSYVWLIIDTSHVLSTALYSSTYKHVNNAAALNTQEGYDRAGRYIRIAVFYNMLFSIPVSFGLIKFMPLFIGMFGYGDKVLMLAQEYTIIAVSMNFLSTASGFVNMIPDIEGHADFDSMWDLFDNAIDIVFMLVVVPYMKPSLFELGLVQLVQSLISTVLYYAVTICWRKWFVKYENGLFSGLTTEIGDKAAVKTLLRKTVPMFADAVTDELEWLVLTFIAARIGLAESAAWILSSYIWGFMTVIPNCISSASEMRVSHLLSRDNSTFSKRLANFSLILSGLSASFCAVILYFIREQIVYAMTNDKLLFNMLCEIIPYFVLCQPLISITTTASYLNRAMGMYKKSTLVDFFMTCLVTVPCACVATEYYGYNIEGLIAASFIGYGTMSLLTLSLFKNADWKKAAEKNMKMSGFVPNLEEGKARLCEIATTHSSTSEFSRKIPTNAKNSTSAAIPIGSEAGIILL